MRVGGGTDTFMSLLHYIGLCLAALDEKAGTS